MLKVECTYKNSATFDDCIALYTKIADYSPIKLKFIYEARKITEDELIMNHNQIMNEPTGELITTGVTEHMWVNKDFKPTRLHRSAPDFYSVIEKYGEQEK